MNNSHRPQFALRRTSLLTMLLLLALLASSSGVSAQTPDVPPTGNNPILFLPLLTTDGANTTAEAEVDASKAKPPAVVKLLIDTDPGVDDAVALTWLFSQSRQPLQVLGIVSVAGNSSIANTTNNAITILEKLGRQDVPVVMGAAAPLAQPLSKTSYFIHGPDGLWFLGLQNPHDLSNIPGNAPAFYCTTAAANPGLRLLALGPLTNIAQAVQQCPDTMRTVEQLVILGGAKFGGNKTPVAEFNFWQDPEAADIVLNAGLPITLVLLDAFTQPTLDQKDLNKVLEKGNPTIQFLAPALQQYVNVQLTNSGRAGIPDAVAAVLAFDTREGTRQPALVKMVVEPSLARGQSVIGLTAGERVAMIASDSELSALADRAFAVPPDPNFNIQWELGGILMRSPENAQAVTSAPATLLARQVWPDIRAK